MNIKDLNTIEQVEQFLTGTLRHDLSGLSGRGEFTSVTGGFIASMTMQFMYLLSGALR